MWKVGIQPRVETCPDNRIERRAAFPGEFKNSELLAAPKRIVSLVLRSREAAEFVETQKERATPEQGRTKKLPPVRLYKPPNHVPTRFMRTFTISPIS